MATKSYTIRWGILATGGIAATFAKDILTNPASRGVHDVQHVLAAAASSTSTARATAFLEDVQAPDTAKPYGSYAELVNDPDVDVIYVATPHSHHFQNSMLALNAGKPVLCEKAFTVNAEQARKLVETARAKKLFLMEAVWTRYFPLSIKIREAIKAGEIGKMHRVVADLSFSSASEDGSLDFEDSNRMVNLDLAGGALLDLGIYALTWNFQTLYHCQPEPREAPKVFGSIIKYDKTGADEMTNITLSFEGQKSMGIAMTALRVASDPVPESSSAAVPAARIQGTKGEIQVFGPLYRPTRYRIIKTDKDNESVEEVSCPIPTDPKRTGPAGKESEGWGHGMFWEADEVARCLRDGKLESESLTLAESLVIMETMDEVRRQGGLKYPDLIETAVYDPASPLNGRS